MDCICRADAASGYWLRADVRQFTYAEHARIGRVAKGRHASYGRHRDAVSNGRSKSKGMKDDALGAAGELAFCLMMGLPWPESVDTFRDEPDIPPDNEVRTTRGYRNIIIHTEDREGPRSELRYNAVVYGAGVFTLWGWIMGHEAQGWPLEDRGGFGRPACFIPVESLHRYPVIARHRPPKPPQIAIGL